MAGAHFYRCLFAKINKWGRLQASTFPGKYKRRETAGGQNGKRNEAAGWLCPEVTSCICLPRSRLKNDSPNSAARRHCVVLSNNPLMKTKRRPPVRSVKETSSLLLRLLPVFLHGDCLPFRGIMLKLCDNDRNVVMNFPGAGKNHFLEN